MDTVIKAKRSTVRTQTTKLFKKIETKLFENNYSEDDLEELLAELELKHTELDNLDSQIFSTITDPNHVEPEVLKCDEYNTGIVINKSKIKKAMSKLKKPADNISVLNDGINESAVIRPFEPPYVNLPRLTIEKFNGDPSDWQRFYDQFDSAINQNSQISKVDKFNYLRSYLTGVASDAIKGFSLTNNNYQAALEALKERFGQKTVVVNSHLNKLLNLTPVKKSNDIVALRKLLDICLTEIRNLDALEVKSDKYGSLLCPILIKLLPQDIVLEIAKQCDSDENWDVSRVLNILKTEITYREKAQILIKDSRDREFYSQSNSSFHNVKNEKFQNVKNVTKYPTASNLLNDTGKNYNMCLACNAENHALNECKVFSSYPLQRKKEFLMKYGFCFICLKRWHTAKFCKSQVKCSKCNGRHQEIMCFSKQIKSADQSQNLLEQVNYNNDEEYLENTVLTNQSCTKEVYLPTLITVIQGKDSEHCIRLIYDSGSQKSYISTFAAKVLNLESIGEGMVTHGLFGGIKTSVRHKRYMVNISSVDKKYQCAIEVMDQDTICASIPKIQDKKWTDELKTKGISVSDISVDTNSCLYQEDPNEIHMLLGSDIMGKLITGKIKNLSSGLVAIHTKLGWTVMGKSSNNCLNVDSSLLVLSLHVHDASEKTSENSIDSEQKNDNVLKIDEADISKNSESVVTKMDATVSEETIESDNKVEVEIHSEKEVIDEEAGVEADVEEMSESDTEEITVIETIMYDVKNISDVDSENNTAANIKKITSANTKDANPEKDLGTFDVAPKTNNDKITEECLDVKPSGIKEINNQLKVDIDDHIVKSSVEQPESTPVLPEMYSTLADPENASIKSSSSDIDIIDENIEENVTSSFLHPLSLSISSSVDTSSVLTSSLDEDKSTKIEEVKPFEKPELFSVDPESLPKKSEVHVEQSVPTKLLYEYEQSFEEKRENFRQKSQKRHRNAQSNVFGVILHFLRNMKCLEWSLLGGLVIGLYLTIVFNQTNIFAVLEKEDVDQMKKMIDDLKYDDKLLKDQMLSEMKNEKVFSSFAHPIEELRKENSRLNYMLYDVAKVLEKQKDTADKYEKKETEYLAPFKKEINKLKEQIDRLKIDNEELQKQLVRIRYASYSQGEKDISDDKYKKEKEENKRDETSSSDDILIDINSLLKKSNWNRIKSDSDLLPITWKFIPPSAPWWGGFCKRLIGLLKRILEKVLGKTLLNYEEMTTTICDCESIKQRWTN